MVQPMEHMGDTNVKRKQPSRVVTPNGNGVEFSRIRNLRVAKGTRDVLWVPGANR